MTTTDATTTYKKAIDLLPGDKVPVREFRTVVEVRRAVASVTVVYDDGSPETLDLSGDPTVEVVVDPPVATPPLTDPVVA